MYKFIYSINPFKYIISILINFLDYIISIYKPFIV